MPLVLDIVILAVPLLFALLGARRGFILTLCSLAAVLVALIGADLAADALAPRLAHAIQPRLEQSIQEALEEKAAQVSAQDALGVEDALAALRDKGGIYEWAADGLDDILDSSLTDTVAQQAAAAAAAVAERLAHGLVFLLAFFVVLVVWAVLAHALDLVAKLPGLSALNRGLGALLGLVKGLVLLYAALWLLSDVTGVIPREAVEGSRLLPLLTRFSPLDILLSV